MDKEPKPVSAIVLCHTKELAYQIKKEIVRLTKFLTNIKTEVIYGGESIDN